MQERRLLRAIGKAVGTGVESVGQGPTAEALARVRDVHQQLAALDTAQQASLDADRRDYNAVGRWMRPLVVVRGLADRAVLRQRQAHLRGALRSAYAALADAAIAEVGAAQASTIPPEPHRSLVATRAVVGAAEAELQSVLAPWDGRVLPHWGDTIAREGRALGIAAWSQTQSRLFPKLPAVAGLAVGWWVANTFTDSRWHATWRGLGIGDGGRRLVSEQTLDAMTVGLPIAAAALCAYLGDRASRWLKQRYATADAAPAEGSQRTTTLA